jgi:hypothetical protein
MKNIHVIPTDKEPIKGDLLLRHLWKGEPNECISWWRYNDTAMYGDTLVYTTLNGSFMDVPSSFKVQNIYITSDEEIKDGDWVLDLHNQIWKLLEGKLIGFDNQGNKRFSTDNIEAHNPKKIILTTDLQLIADGVQAITDEFLEWFVKNPSCEKVEVKQELGVCLNCEWNYDSCPNTEECLKDNYKIIIPKEELKSSEEWQNQFPNPKVLDPDGWDRKNYQYSWFEEKITLIEYTSRLSKSTVKGLIPKEEPKQEYKYIGECNGNNDNGCFLDSPAHDCGCFTRVVKDEPKQQEQLLNFKSE